MRSAANRGGAVARRVGIAIYYATTTRGGRVGPRNYSSISVNSDSAGPASTSPVGLDREPRLGQSHVFSAMFHATPQPRCVSAWIPIPGSTPPTITFSSGSPELRPRTCSATASSGPPITTFGAGSTGSAPCSSAAPRAAVSQRRSCASSGADYFLMGVPVRAVGLSPDALYRLSLSFRYVAHGRVSAGSQYSGSPATRSFNSPFSSM